MQMNPIQSKGGLDIVKVIPARAGYYALYFTTKKCDAEVSLPDFDCRKLEIVAWGITKCSTAVPICNDPIIYGTSELAEMAQLRPDGYVYSYETVVNAGEPHVKPYYYFDTVIYPTVIDFLLGKLKSELRCFCYKSDLDFEELWKKDRVHYKCVATNLYNKMFPPID